MYLFNTIPSVSQHLPKGPGSLLLSGFELRMNSDPVLGQGLGKTAMISSSYQPRTSRLHLFVVPRIAPCHCIACSNTLIRTSHPTPRISSHLPRWYCCRAKTSRTAVTWHRKLPSHRNLSFVCIPLPQSAVTVDTPAIHVRGGTTMKSDGYEMAVVIYEVKSYLSISSGPRDKSHNTSSVEGSGAALRVPRRKFDIHTGGRDWFALHLFQIFPLWLSST